MRDEASGGIDDVRMTRLARLDRRDVIQREAEVHSGDRHARVFAIGHGDAEVRLRSRAEIDRAEVRTAGARLRVLGVGRAVDALALAIEREAGDAQLLFSRLVD